MKCKAPFAGSPVYDEHFGFIYLANEVVCFGPARASLATSGSSCDFLILLLAKSRINRTLKSPMTNINLFGSLSSSLRDFLTAAKVAFQNFVWSTLKVLRLCSPYTFKIVSSRCFPLLSVVEFLRRIRSSRTRSQSVSSRKGVIANLGLIDELISDFTYSKRLFCCCRPGLRALLRAAYWSCFLPRSDTDRLALNGCSSSP